MKLSELINKLKELEELGYGDKSLVFDNTYSISGVDYEEEEDYIEVY